MLKNHAEDINAAMSEKIRARQMYSEMGNLNFGGIYG